MIRISFYDFTSRWMGEQKQHEKEEREWKERLEKNGFEMPLTFHWGRKVHYFRRSYFWAKVQAILLLLGVCVGFSMLVWYLWGHP